MSWQLWDKIKQRTIIKLALEYSNGAPKEEKNNLKNTVQYIHKHLSEKGINETVKNIYEFLLKAPSEKNKSKSTKNIVKSSNSISSNDPMQLLATESKSKSFEGGASQIKCNKIKQEVNLVEKHDKAIVSPKRGKQLENQVVGKIPDNSDINTKATKNIGSESRPDNVVQTSSLKICRQDDKLSKLKPRDSQPCVKNRSPTTKDLISPKGLNDLEKLTSSDTQDESIFNSTKKRSVPISELQSKTEVLNGDITPKKCDETVKEAISHKTSNEGTKLDSPKKPKVTENLVGNSKRRSTRSASSSSTSKIDKGKINTKENELPMSNRDSSKSCNKYDLSNVKQPNSAQATGRRCRSGPTDVESFQGPKNLEPLTSSDTKDESISNFTKERSVPISELQSKTEVLNGDITPKKCEETVKEAISHKTSNEGTKLDSPKKPKVTENLVGNSKRRSTRSASSSSTSKIDKGKINTKENELPMSNRDSSKDCNKYDLSNVKQPNSAQATGRRRRSGPTDVESFQGTKNVGKSLNFENKDEPNCSNTGKKFRHTTKLEEIPENGHREITKQQNDEMINEKNSAKKSGTDAMIVLPQKLRKSENKLGLSNNSERNKRNNESAPSSDTSKLGTRNNESAPSSVTPKLGTRNNESAPSSDTSKLGTRNNESAPSSDTSKLGTRNNESAQSSDTSKLGTRNNESAPSSNTSKIGTTNKDIESNKIKSNKDMSLGSEVCRHDNESVKVISLNDTQPVGRRRRLNDTSVSAGHQGATKEPECATSLDKDETICSHSGKNILQTSTVESNNEGFQVDKGTTKENNDKTIKVASVDKESGKNTKATIPTKEKIPEKSYDESKVLDRNEIHNSTISVSDIFKVNNIEHQEREPHKDMPKQDSPSICRQGGKSLKRLVENTHDTPPAMKRPKSNASDLTYTQGTESSISDRPTVSAPEIQNFVPNSRMEMEKVIQAKFDSSTSKNNDILDELYEIKFDKMSKKSSRVYPCKVSDRNRRSSRSSSNSNTSSAFPDITITSLNNEIGTNECKQTNAVKFLVEADVQVPLENTDSDKPTVSFSDDSNTNIETRKTETFNDVGVSEQKETVLHKIVIHSDTKKPAQEREARTTSIFKNKSPADSPGSMKAKNIGNDNGANEKLTDEGSTKISTQSTVQKPMQTRASRRLSTPATVETETMVNESNNEIVERDSSNISAKSVVQKFTQSRLSKKSTAPPSENAVITTQLTKTVNFDIENKTNDEFEGTDSSQNQIQSYLPKPLLTRASRQSSLPSSDFALVETTIDGAQVEPDVQAPTQMEQLQAKQEMEINVKKKSKGRKTPNRKAYERQRKKRNRPKLEDTSIASSNSSEPNSPGRALTGSAIVESVEKKEVFTTREHSSPTITDYYALEKIEEESAETKGDEPLQLPFKKIKLHPPPSEISPEVTPQVTPQCGAPICSFNDILPIMGAETPDAVSSFTKKQSDLTSHSIVTKGSETATNVEMDNVPPSQGCSGFLNFSPPLSPGMVYPETPPRSTKLIPESSMCDNNRQECKRVCEHVTNIMEKRLRRFRVLNNKTMKKYFKQFRLLQNKYMELQKKYDELQKKIMELQ